MDNLSPTWSQQSDVPVRRLQPVPETMAVGKTTTPKEERHVGQSEILCPRGRTKLGVYGRPFATEWQGQTPAAATSSSNANRTTRSNPCRCESVRPGLGTLPRASRRCQDGANPAGATTFAVPVEGARGSLSGLQPKDHRTDKVAYPPSCLEVLWRERWERELGAAPSQLS